MVSSPAELEFFIVDVFTNKKYEGNPLAIVHVPPSVILTQEQKQTIAREFNLSETTFLHEAESDDASSWTVDIFTTWAELPFAGHPTIGTACHVLSSVARSRQVADGKVEGGFTIKAGPIGLQYDVGKGIAKAAIPHNVHIHKRTFAQRELLKVQQQLAEASSQKRINLKEEFPIVSIVKGMTFVLVELESEEALKMVKTTGSALSVDGLDIEWSETFVGMYFFVRSQDTPDGTKVLRTRMIEGTLEDPATGSAASGLAGYLSLVEGKPQDTLTYKIVQGVEMGRRSEIYLEVVMADKGSGIADIYLSGSTVQVMTGRLTI